VTSQEEIPRRLSVPPIPRLILAIGTLFAIGSVVGLLIRVASWGITAVPLALLFAGPAWLMARATLMQVRVGADGVRVRNLLHAYEVGWNEIEGLDVIHQATGIGSYAQILRNGAPPITLGISMFDVRGSRVAADRAAQPIQAALDRARARAANPAGASSSSCSLVNGAVQP
jgi:hypothetical protein